MSISIIIFVIFGFISSRWFWTLFSDAIVRRNAIMLFLPGESKCTFISHKCRPDSLEMEYQFEFTPNKATA
jgi:hypothetical protein